MADPRAAFVVGFAAGATAALLAHRTAGNEGEMTIRNQRTEEGAELGREMARLCDEAEPRARLRMPALPPRCNSCAFRAGKHLASGSPATQLNAMKCVMEGVEFMCHEPARDGALCSGWAIFMLAKDEADFTAVPWDFVGGVDKAS